MATQATSLTNVTGTVSQKAVGFSANAVSKIQAQFKTYINTAKKDCQIEATANQLHAAIKGGNSFKTFKALTDEITAKMRAFLTTLAKYDDNLTQIQAAYKKNDSSNASFTSGLPKN